MTDDDIQLLRLYIADPINNLFEVCTDGTDNDCDGDIDQQDSKCQSRLTNPGGVYDSIDYNDDSMIDKQDEAILE